MSFTSENQYISMELNSYQYERERCTSVYSDLLEIKSNHFESSYYQQIDFPLSQSSFYSAETTLLLQQNVPTFSKQGAITALLLSEEFLKDKSEYLSFLSSEVQDLSLMSNDEKEMIIKEFKSLQKSNIYKNILRSFTRFMMNSKNFISLECLDKNNKSVPIIRNQFQRYLKNISHSQNIIRIMKSQRFSVFFDYYLKEYFLEDLYNGQFKNIRDHFIVNVFFLICLQDPEQISHIKSLDR